MNIHLNEAAAWGIIVPIFIIAFTIGMILSERNDTEVDKEAIKAGLVQKTDSWGRTVWVEKGTK